MTTTYEDSQPGWQRWLNQFCESWLFAFIVVVAFKHFLFELYVIPSASMEPTLYGDPSFFKADKVIAAKFPVWLDDPERWDVTVFEYPVPEIIVAGQHVGAEGPAGQRLDNLITSPLVHRNFVKRLLALPGETFFIDQGDIFIRQPDGSWRQPDKPAAIQEALWTTIYHHRAEQSVPYTPWESLHSGATVQRGEHDTLVLNLAPEAAVVGTQPLVNLYVKEGEVGVTKKRSGERLVVETSMTAPAFAVPGRGTASIWDIEQWEVYRRSTADLDARGYGKLLNEIGGEAIRDVRVTMVPIAIAGTVALDLREGDQPPHTLVLSATGWQLQHAGTVLASGDQAPVDRPVALTHVDDQLWVTIAGQRVSEIIDTSQLTPAADARSVLRWHGSGRITLDDLRIERDVHYSRMGFLLDERRPLGPMQERYAGEGKEQVGYPCEVLAVGASRERPITVPENGYVLLGDNSPHSLDSRAWGFVPAANLRGQVWFVIDRFDVVE
jgi:signal peptidase I